ncbi:TetR/AcrR family transcriptional regulator [Actinomadura welshii]
MGTRDQTMPLVLINAAREFAARGYEAATIRRIAGCAGVSAGTVFHYFPTKRDLLVEVVAEGTRRTSEHVRTRLEGIDTAERRLVELVRAHLEGMHGENRPFSTVATREFDKLDAGERRQVVEVRDAYERLWQDVIDEAARQGLVSSDPLLRLFLIGAVNNTFFWYDPAADLSIAELAERFVSFVRLPA